MTFLSLLNRGSGVVAIGAIVVGPQIPLLGAGVSAGARVVGGGVVGGCVVVGAGVVDAGVATIDCSYNFTSPQSVRGFANCCPLKM